MSDRDTEAGRWRHDMKNQMGIILGFSELLLDDMSANDARRADIEEIHKAAEKAMLLLSGRAAEEAGRP